MGLLGGAKTALNGVPGLPLGDILLGDLDRFLKGFVFEVYDQREPEKALITKALVLNPRRYNLSEPFAVTLTPTEDDTVVAEENGIIIREIVIEGTTGLSDKKEEALGRGGQIGTEASGTEHFYQLRQMFRDYSDMKKDSEKSPYIQMFFHNVKEDDHFVVVPRSFETPRDAATNRMHFNYRITLAAIQKLPPPPIPTEFDFFGWEPGQDVLEFIKEATKVVNDARTYFVETINEIEILRHRIRNPEEILENVALFLNSAYEFTIGVVDSVEVGVEFAATALDLLEDLQEVVDNDIDGLQPMNEYQRTRGSIKLRQRLERLKIMGKIFTRPLGDDTTRPFAGEKNLTDNDMVNQLAGATVGSRLRVALGSEADAGLNFGAFGGSQEVDITAIDTIDTLATKHRVPREAIIELNNLIYPYITRSGGPGTLKPGQSILIPRRTGGTTQGVYPSEFYLTPEDILYGVDLALDPKLAEEGIFDLKIDELHGSTDVELARGVKNLIQGVHIIVDTEKGSTTFIKDLGIKRTPGVKGTLNMMLTSSIHLREAILSDPRITGIDSTRIVLEGDKLEQEITPILLNERDGVTLVTPFGTAASG